MHDKVFWSAHMKIGLVIAAVAVIYILSLLAPLEVQTSLKKEGSWIELTTLAAYVAALIYILAYRLYAQLKWIFWLIVLLAMRELDFDARFTDAKITKWEFLLNPDISWLQTIYGFSLLAFGAFVAFKVATVHLKNLLVEAKAASSCAMASILAILAAALSKLIDGPRRKFGYIGAELTDHSVIALQLLEEVLELSIPLFILVALTEYATKIRRLGFS